MWTGDSSPRVAGYLIWNESQWRDSLSSARVNPVANGYLGKAGEGKQKRSAKADLNIPAKIHFKKNEFLKLKIHLNK